MLTFKLQESLESATEKLRVIKESIVGRTATAKEVNEINKYENLIYKYNKEEEDIKRKALDKSSDRIINNLRNKRYLEWLEIEKATMYYRILVATEKDGLRNTLADIFEKNLTIKNYLKI